MDYSTLRALPRTLQQQFSNGLQRLGGTPSVPEFQPAVSFNNVGAGVAMQAQPHGAPQVQPYQGTINQQFDQALDRKPRYVSPNPATQALNTQYDDAFGYTGLQRRNS